MSAIGIVVGLLLGCSQSMAAGSLEDVGGIKSRPEWNRFKILVWQYNTDAMRDMGLYRQLGLGGYHIDRGAGRDDLVAFSMTEQFPYYVDHAADKGILYLRKDERDAVKRKRGLVTRPHSLADPETIGLLKKHLRDNIEATRKGLVLAYAFDDEISLGSFVNPCDVDNHPRSIEGFRSWLRGKYGSIDPLNAKWETRFKSFDAVVPKGFDEVRKSLGSPLSRWNLAPWIDFRRFMDFQFASVLSELTRYANGLDPATPAGFVGGQGPGPWGGYDYAMLGRAVQWMEAYDIHGTNEILRSFWNHERRPRMQTFFSKKDPKLDSWFLWYYLLHGNQAVIAWPDGWFRTGGHEIAPHVLALKNTFEEIQGKVSEPIVNPKTVFDPDPIGVYYSHPSLQAGWAMDAITHGKTWPHRESSVDDGNQTAGILRVAWCKLLEDLGFQYDLISYLDVEGGRIDLRKKFKVIVLPRTLCLSDREARALEDFVKEGGTLVADYLCGVLDEHGKGRGNGALDGLFGIVRNEKAGYMNGAGLTEIDAEKHREPFLVRFTNYDGAYRYRGITVFERGTKHRQGGRGVEIKGGPGKAHACSIRVENDSGKGKAFYLNLSPVQYYDPRKRFSDYGTALREIVSGIVDQAGVRPRVKVYENGSSANMIEALHWKNGSRTYVGLIKNPTEEKGLREIGQPFKIQGITGEEVEVKLEFKAPVRSLINLRTGKNLGQGQVFRDGFKPWEGNLYEVEF